jgi:hypothetical protein
MDQAARGAFCVYTIPSPKAMLSINVVYLIMVVGILSVHIKKVGSAVKTKFTSSSRPGWDKNFEEQANLLSILCTRGRKCCNLGFEAPRGIEEQANCPPISPPILNFTL